MIFLKINQKLYLMKLKLFPFAFIFSLSSSEIYLLFNILSKQELNKLLLYSDVFNASFNIPLFNI